MAECNPFDVIGWITAWVDAAKDARSPYEATVVIAKREPRAYASDTGDGSSYSRGKQD